LKSPSVSLLLDIHQSKGTAANKVTLRPSETTMMFKQTFKT